MNNNKEYSIVLSTIFSLDIVYHIESIVFGYDSTGMYSVWIKFIILDDLNNNLINYINLIEKEIIDNLFINGLEAWPYITFKKYDINEYLKFNKEYKKMINDNFSTNLISDTVFSSSMSKEERRKMFFGDKKERVYMKLENQKVSLEDIENNIKHKEVCKFITKEGKILRFGVITLQNGFAVTGNPSATVNPLNDNIELGEEIALNNAKQKIWELMGYELATKIKESSKE